MNKVAIDLTFPLLSLLPNTEYYYADQLYTKVKSEGFDPDQGMIETFRNPNEGTVTLRWTTTMNHKTFVIAGTPEQAKEWIKKHYDQTKGEINLIDYVIVTSPDQLRGYKDPNGVFTGTWYTRGDALDILSLIDVSLTDKEKREKFSKIIDAYYERKGVG